MASAIAKLNEAGFSTTGVLTAWDETLNNLWRMLEDDPDPADDPKDVLDWKLAMF